MKPPPGPRLLLWARAHGASPAFVWAPAAIAGQQAGAPSSPVCVLCVLPQKDDKVTPEARQLFFTWWSLCADRLFVAHA